MQQRFKNYCSGGSIHTIWVNKWTLYIFLDYIQKLKQLSMNQFWKYKAFWYSMIWTAHAKPKCLNLEKIGSKIEKGLKMFSIRKRHSNRCWVWKERTWELENGLHMSQGYTQGQNEGHRWLPKKARHWHNTRLSYKMVLSGDRLNYLKIVSNWSL